MSRARPRYPINALGYIQGEQHTRRYACPFLPATPTTTANNDRVSLTSQVGVGDDVPLNAGPRSTALAVGLGEPSPGKNNDDVHDDMEASVDGAGDKNISSPPVCPRSVGLLVGVAVGWTGVPPTISWVVGAPVGAAVIQLSPSFSPRPRAVGLLVDEESAGGLGLGDGKAVEFRPSPELAEDGGTVDSTLSGESSSGDRVDPVGAAVAAGGVVRLVADMVGDAVGGSGSGLSSPRSTEGGDVFKVGVGVVAGSVPRAPWLGVIVSRNTGLAVCPLKGEAVLDGAAEYVDEAPRC